jgi:integrase
MIRIFFERLIDWDWPDAPRRNPILHGDIPPRPEPLPKFLDDRDAARLMAAARAHPDPRTRLVVEMLARTGLRAGELCDLAADAVTQIGDAHWLRVPVGKLRNDRYIPLHPDLITLLAHWTARNADHIRAQRRLIADHRAHSKDAPSIASSAGSPNEPGSATSTRTSCATPWPPKRSTAACDSKRSPPSSATARWR